MTRLWQDEGIQVECDLDKAPLLFVWKGQRHPVERIANHWRVDFGWWQLRIWREHYKLTTRTGLLVIIYHDLINDRWYLQRLYD